MLDYTICLEDYIIKIIIHAFALIAIWQNNLLYI